MRQAFLILVHKNYEQIKVLINDIIADPQCDVYVHVDFKSNALYQELVKFYGNNQKVTLASERESVYWGDFSQVKATLALLKSAVRNNYDHFSLISGQDYMIKPLSEFNSFLARNRGWEFIEARKRNNTWRVKLAHRHIRQPKFRQYRYYRYYALCLSLINYRRKQHVSQYKIYFGSQWFTLSNSAVSYILSFVADNPGFVEDFATSTCGDEHFFQTILMNSEFKSKIYNNNLRFIKFKFRGNSPVAISADDEEEMANSEQFIARKFNWETDEELIMRLSSRQRLDN